MKEQEIYFETVYKEYKDYMNFIDSKLDIVKKEREEFKEFAAKNSSQPEILVEKIFEVNQKPAFYQGDALRLQTRLVHTYEAYKDLLTIPEDVVKEIQGIKLVKNIYTIKNGEAIDIDPTYTESIKKTVRQEYDGFLKNIFEANKNK